MCGGAGGVKGRVSIGGKYRNFTKFRYFCYIWGPRTPNWTKQIRYSEISHEIVGGRVQTFQKSGIWAGQTGANFSKFRNFTKISTFEALMSRIQTEFLQNSNGSVSSGRNWAGMDWQIFSGAILRVANVKRVLILKSEKGSNFAKNSAGLMHPPLLAGTKKYHFWSVFDAEHDAVGIFWKFDLHGPH